MSGTGKEGSLRTMVLLLVAFWLGMFLCWHIANAEEGLDLDPTMVLVLRSDMPHTVGSRVPVLNGTRYILCVAVYEELPRVRCLRPTKILGSTEVPGQDESMVEFAGPWETSYILLGGEGA